MAKIKSTLGGPRLFNKHLLFLLNYGLFAAASLLLLLLDASGMSSMQSVRRVGEDIVFPIRAVVYAPVYLVQDMVDSISDLATLRAENEVLSSENEALLGWRQKALQLQAENSSLRQLLNYDPVPLWSKRSARIITRVGGPFVRSALIDAGHKQNVALNSVAISAQGLVGRVTNVGQHTSRLLFLTDVNSRIPVYVGSERITAVMAGNNDNQPRLLYLPDKAEIPLGARVVTSGHGGVFPADILVGHVTEADVDRPHVQLVIHPDRLDHIRLLVPQAEMLLPLPQEAQEVQNETSPPPATEEP